MTFRAMRDADGAAAYWNQEQLQALSSVTPFAAAAVSRPHATPTPEPVSEEEVAALLAVVPRGCRTDAQWAVPLLLETARSGGITHPRRIAYLLATAHHGARFGAQLVEAGLPDGDERDPYFERFEPGTPLGTARGNTEPGDGARFRGRGFVYVCGRTDYALWSQRLNMPEEIVDGRSDPYFIAHPEALARPDIAAQTLVRGMRDGIFTGVALGNFVNDKKTDYVNARRVVGNAAHARDVAALAVVYQTAIEALQSEHHRAHMAKLASRRSTHDGNRDFLGEVRDAVERLARRGEIMPPPTDVLDWSGEARQGKFVQLDERTCALHVGRGSYLRLDIQRDLNGIVPPEAKNMALKRSGEFRSALRSADGDFWR